MRGGNLRVICASEFSQSDLQVVLGGRGTVATAFEPRVKGFAASTGASSGMPDVPSRENCYAQARQVPHRMISSPGS